MTIENSSPSAVIVAAVREIDARLVGVTGPIAVGKSTIAEAVVRELQGSLLSSDGFLFSGRQLVDRGLSERKGFPESYDHQAFQHAIQQWRNHGVTEAPVYSHLTYDVVLSQKQVIAGSPLIVEGLHLGHEQMGVSKYFDLLVHIDADDEHLKAWYLQRFSQLRQQAALDASAFLYPFRDLPDEFMNQMAMDIWESVNQHVIDEEIRPAARNADFVIILDVDHEVTAVNQPR